MKYAHVERERRYLFLESLAELVPIRNLFIQDRYFPESTLRLRRIEEEGKPTVFKLGQKIRVGEERPLRIAHTTMFLSLGEFEALAVLPAKILEKQRSIFPLGELHFVVDEFGGELAGLLMLEVDLGAEGSTHPVLPFEELIEITLDERFTGGELAGTSSEDLGLLLTEYGVN